MGLCARSERSAAWLAHQSGGLGVGGSNPLAPTNTLKDLSPSLRATQTAKATARQQVAEARGVTEGDTSPVRTSPVRVNSEPLRTGLYWPRPAQTHDRQASISRPRSPLPPVWRDGKACSFRSLMPRPVSAHDLLDGWIDEQVAQARICILHGTRALQAFRLVRLRNRAP